MSDLEAKIKLLEKHHKCDALDELVEAYRQKCREANLLLELAAHYSFLEVNDNGDYEEPACKIMQSLGYNKDNKFNSVGWKQALSQLGKMELKWGRIEHAKAAPQQKR